MIVKNLKFKYRVAVPYFRMWLQRGFKNRVIKNNPDENMNVYVSPDGFLMAVEVPAAGLTYAFNGFLFSDIVSVSPVSVSYCSFVTDFENIL